MKIKFLISVLFTFSTLSLLAQGVIDFENTTTIEYLTIDTSNHNNIWQIGTPDKILFNHAYSAPYVIITDTVLPYPINNNSEFVVQAIYLGSYNLFLNFLYKINTDSLLDYGKIYASSNHGLSWVDITNNTLPTGLHWSISNNSVLCPGTLNLPFTGTSTVWNKFSFWSSGYNVLSSSSYIDTVLFKFVFHSDSIQSNKEGWMLDNFEFGNYEDIQELSNAGSFLDVYPNPAEYRIRIINNEWEGDVNISVYNIQGQLLFSYLSRQPQDELNISNLANGIYIIKATNNNKIRIGKFFKE